MSRAKSRDTTLPLYFCYILQCSDGTFYVGVTDNPSRRLKEHNSGKAAKYTFTRRPLRMVWTQQYVDLHSARRREAQLQRWSHSKKQALVAGFPRLHP